MNMPSMSLDNTNVSSLPAFDKEKTEHLVSLLIDIKHHLGRIIDLNNPLADGSVKDPIKRAEAARLYTKTDIMIKSLQEKIK